MAEELRQSLEKLGAAADVSHALAVQMAELLKLREADGAQQAQATSPRDDHYRVSRTGRRTWNSGAREASPRRPEPQSRVLQIGSSGLRFNSTRASSRSAHSKRHKENKSSPWQTFHAIPVAMKSRPAAASWRPE